MTTVLVHRSRPRRRRALFAALAALAALAPARSSAATCEVSAAPFAFGAYDTVDQLDVSNNTITVTCRRRSDPQGSVVTWTVALSTGSGTYVARQMSSGAAVLLYNLYTTAARTVVWGNNTSGTGVVTGSITFGQGNNPRSVIHAVHGRIPGGQNVVPGAYTTAVPITVTVVY
jgi:spore coat protein U-like protein